MNEKRYHYTLAGIGANNATWETEGTIVCEWSDVFDNICRDSFRKLTNGNAKYGSPGEGGCKGPYEIRSLFIKLVLQ